MMETFFNISEQTSLFLWSCVVGVGLGFVYDMFRVARIIVKHNKTAVFFEDFIFTVFFALTIFVYSTERARGEIRFYIILGCFLGFILYVFTVGLIVVTITRKVVMVLYKILFILYKIFIAPILKLFVNFSQKTRLAFVKIGKIFKNIYLKLKKSLKKEWDMVYNKHTHTKRNKKRGGKNGNKSKKKEKRLSRSS